MANRREIIPLHVRQGFKKIESALIVPDRLHCATAVSEGFEVWPIIGELRIRRHQHDESTLSQLRSIRTILFLAESHGRLMANLRVGGMEREHGRNFFSFLFQRSFWNQQIGGNA